MKNFKNEFGVAGTLALRKAFRDELLALGWIQQEDHRIETKNYIYCSNSDEQHLKSNHFWYPDSVSNTDKLYQLPQQWNEALKAASEVVEEIPEYVECTKEFNVPKLTEFYKGKIYKVDLESGYVINEQFKRSLRCNWDNTSTGQITQFKPSTKETYDEQNKPVYKVGDWIHLTWKKEGDEDILQIKGLTPTIITTYMHHRNGKFLNCDGANLVIDSKRQAMRLATPEEIAEVTKPKFKVGDWIKRTWNDGDVDTFKIEEIKDKHYRHSNFSRKFAKSRYFDIGTTGMVQILDDRFTDELTTPNPVLPEQITLTLGTSNIKVTVYKDGTIEAEGHKGDIKMVKQLIIGMQVRGKISNWDISYPTIQIGCSQFSVDDLKQIVTAHDKLNPSEW